MKCTPVFSILGCCLVSVSNLLTTFRDSVSVPFLSVKISRNLDVLTLKYWTETLSG